MGGNVLMAGLSRSAMDALPEDAHWSVKLATGLGTGLLAGGMAAKAGMYLPTKFPGLVNQQAMAKVWAARTIAEMTKNAALKGVPNQSMQGLVKTIEEKAISDAANGRFTLDDKGYPMPRSENKSALEAIDRPTLLDEDEIISPDLSGPRLSKGSFDFEFDRYDANAKAAAKAVVDANADLADFTKRREGMHDPFSDFQREEGYGAAPPLYEQLEQIRASALQNPEGEDGIWLASLRDFLETNRDMVPSRAETYLQDFADADRLLAETADLESSLLKPRADDAFKVNNLDGKRVSIWDTSIISNLNNKKINAAVTEVIRNNPSEFNISKTLPLTGRGAVNPYTDSNKAMAKYLEMDESAPELEVERLRGKMLTRQ